MHEREFGFDQYQYHVTSEPGPKAPEHFSAVISNLTNTDDGEFGHEMKPSRGLVIIETKANLNITPTYEL
jgi:hypothetical protein